MHQDHSWWQATADYHRLGRQLGMSTTIQTSCSPPLCKSNILLYHLVCCTAWMSVLVWQLPATQTWEQLWNELGAIKLNQACLLIWILMWIFSICDANTVSSSKTRLFKVTWCRSQHIAHAKSLKSCGQSHDQTCTFIPCQTWSFFQCYGQKIGPRKSCRNHDNLKRFMEISKIPKESQQSWSSSVLHHVLFQLFFEESWSLHNNTINNMSQQSIIGSSSLGVLSLLFCEFVFPSFWFFEHAATDGMDDDKQSLAVVSFCVYYHYSSFKRLHVYCKDCHWNHGQWTLVVFSGWCYFWYAW